MRPRTGCAGLKFAVLQGRRPALFQVVGAMSEKCPAVGRARKHWGSLLLNPKPRPPTYIHGHIYTHIVYCSTQNRAPPTTHCRDLHRLMMGASHRARNQRGIVAEELSTSTPIVLIVIHKCLRWTCILGASIGESHWWLNHGNCRQWAAGCRWRGSRDCAAAMSRQRFDFGIHCDFSDIDSIGPGLLTDGSTRSF